LKITLNGETAQTQAKNLAELCAALGHGLDKIATARNGDFVPATQRAMTHLSENDSIEIVTPRQGG
jgi:sulfur carrier protein